MPLPRFKSKVFLAPMAGITDPAFRFMCLSQGAGLVFTELTSIHAIDAKGKLGERELLRLLSYSKQEKPAGIQLFGNDINATIKSAKIVEPYFDIIDFNLGCPAKHITAQMAGAALLQRAEHMEKLLSGLVSAVNKPVTIKMRAGVNKDKTLFLKIAKIAEDVGVSMITLHPRTVEQGYAGVSDWKLITELKSKVSCPVVGNGDIKTPEDAKRMFDETGCDYIMVGRASSGNPEIFRQINDFLKSGIYQVIAPEQKKEHFLKYLELSSKFHIKFSDIKIQAMYFSRGLKGGVQLRQKIAKAVDTDEIKSIFANHI